MSKGKPLCFEGQTIYCGLDVHKTNWKVSVRMAGVELAGFSQNPDAEALAAYFRRHYPGARIRVVYEAGFCGFGAQRALSALGVECSVVNAADVPTSDKERRRKDDHRDARKLSRELQDGSLIPLYVPSVEMEQARSLLRGRHRLVADLTRCKNRIKHLLLFSGTAVEVAPQRWSNRYLSALGQVACSTGALRTALDLALEQLRQLRCVLKQATQAIRTLSQQPPFCGVQPYLQSIPGIGVVSGMVLQTEVQDIHRFKTLDRLCDYCGLVPDLHASGERTVTKGVTHRCNEFLREAILECAWMLLRHDPAMLLKYNEYRQRMNAQKAIIRVGKHLLSRIRYVWKNQTLYEKGVVA